MILLQTPPSPYLRYVINERPLNSIQILSFQYHKQSCTDRGLLEQYKYEVMSTPQSYPQPLPRKPDPGPVIPVRDSDEEWDDDAPVKAYNPREYCAKAPVIRKAYGTPAQRKAFRQAEYERHKSLNE